jgi:16S rRNA (cytosine967-C5)-methyltransferase
MPSERDVAVQTRAAAARVVDHVARGKRFLDSALDEQRRAAPSGAVALSLLQELAYGTLRWYHQLQGIAALLLARPLKAKDTDLHALLLVGLYQLWHLRVAAHAAVDTTVAAAAVLHKPWAKGLLNACLRSAGRDTTRIAEAIERTDELRYSHPEWLIAAVRRHYGDSATAILDANNARPPLTLRVNQQRLPRGDYLALLNANGIAAHIHAEVASAIVLETPTPIEQLPGFADGAVSVQDAAAQLAALYLDARPGEHVLDACAAPGGKTAHVLERTPGVARLVALDINAERVTRLRDGLARLGLRADIVIGDAAQPSGWWDGRLFDRILVDAPCSATGVIRRHPDIKVRREAEELPKLQETQARVLDGVWPCLKPGGKLVYVTCSLLGEENRQQIEGFLERQASATPAPLAAPGSAWQRQIVTGEHEMDGFYYACLRKT